MQTLKLQYSQSSDITEDTSLSQVHRLSGECIEELAHRSNRASVDGSSYLAKFENKEMVIPVPTTSPRGLKLVVFEGIGKIQQSFRKLARAVCKPNPVIGQIRPKIDYMTTLLQQYEPTFKIALETNIQDFQRVSLTIKDGVNLIKNLVKEQRKYPTNEEANLLIDELRRLLSQYASSRKATLRSMCSFSSVDEEPMKTPSDDKHSCSIPEQMDEGGIHGSPTHVKSTQKGSKTLNFSANLIPINSMTNSLGIPSLGHIEELASHAEQSVADISKGNVQVTKKTQNQPSSELSEEGTSLVLQPKLEGFEEIRQPIVEFGVDLKNANYSSLNSKQLSYCDDGVNINEKSSDARNSLRRSFEPTDSNRRQDNEKVQSVMTEIQSPLLSKSVGLVDLRGVEQVGIIAKSNEPGLKNKFIYIVDNHLIDSAPEVIGSRSLRRVDIPTVTGVKTSKLEDPIVKTKKLSLGLVKGLKNSLSSCSNDTGKNDIEIPLRQGSYVTIPDITVIQPQLKFSQAREDSRMTAHFGESTPTIHQNDVAPSNCYNQTNNNQQSSQGTLQANNSSPQLPNATDQHAASDREMISELVKMIKEASIHIKSIEEKNETRFELLNQKVENLEVENAKLKKTLLEISLKEKTIVIPKSSNNKNLGSLNQNLYSPDKFYTSTKDDIPRLQPQNVSAQASNQNIAAPRTGRPSGHFYHRSSPSVADELLFSTTTIVTQQQAKNQLRGDESKRSSIAPSESNTTSIFKASAGPHNRQLNSPPKETNEDSIGTKNTKLIIPQYLKPFFKSAANQSGVRKSEVSYKLNSPPKKAPSSQASSFRKVNTNKNLRELNQSIDVILSKTKPSRFNTLTDNSGQKPQSIKDYDSLMSSTVPLDQNSRLFKECCLKRSGCFYTSKDLSIHSTGKISIYQGRGDQLNIGMDLLLVSTAGFSVDSVKILNYSKPFVIIRINGIKADWRQSNKSAHPQNTIHNGGSRLSTSPSFVHANITRTKPLCRS